MNYRILKIIILACLCAFSGFLKAMENTEDLAKTRGIYFASPFYGSQINYLFSKADKTEEKIPPKRYLVVKPLCGLANRLRVLACSDIMAGISDRELLVHWLAVENEMPVYWSDLFDSPLDRFEKSKLADEYSINQIKASIPRRPNILNLGCQNDESALKRLSDLPNDKQPIIYFATTIFFRPAEEFSSQKEWFERRKQYYENLVPVKRVKEAIKLFKKK